MENFTVLHDEALPVTATQKGSVGGVEVPPLDFGTPPRVISARIELDITSWTHGGFSGEVRMFKGPTILGLKISEFRFAPDFTVLSTGSQILIYPFSNVSPEEVSPGRLSSFGQFELFVPGGVSIDLKATFFEGIAFIVQSKVAPVTDANVYQSVSDAEARLAEFYPLNDSYSALPDDRKGPVLISATARIEQEVILLCQPSGSSPVDPDNQRLLWQRDVAYSAAGPIIDSWLDSWENAILLYADQVAKAELSGKFADEPSEDQGVKKVLVGPAGADYEREYNTDGFSGNFFEGRGRAAILALLAESFPHGGLS